jgi:hypothetical protein
MPVVLSKIHAKVCLHIEAHNMFATYSQRFESFLTQFWSFCTAISIPNTLQAGFIDVHSSSQAASNQLRTIRLPREAAHCVKSF